MCYTFQKRKKVQKMNKEEQQKLLRKRIIQYIDKKNLSVNRLAELSNVRQSTLNNIINRGTIPKIDTIKAICDGLNISVKDFFDFPPYNKTIENEENTPIELIEQIKLLNNKVISLDQKLKELKK